MQKGIVYAASAYVLWGLLPLYWKALHGVPALEILTHRMVWALVVVALLLAYQRQWRWLPGVLRDGRVLATFGASALLLSFNWFVYIWAVNADHVVDASLGYFINPLVNVLLGMLFLKERLRPWQTGAVVIALCGVLVLTISRGAIPWVALSLAISFGLYGLLRKTAPLNSLQGLTVETLLLFIPALSYLVWVSAHGAGAFERDGWQTSALLAGGGIATAMPLLLFAAGARLLTFTTLGLLQYIAPTMQFLIGLLVYHEPLSRTQLFGFCLIWVALALYTMESMRHSRWGVPLRPATVRPNPK